MPRRFLAWLVLALAAGVLSAWALSACGSGGTGTVADEAGKAVSNAKTEVAGKSNETTAPEKEKRTTPTVPERTTTVERPAQTTTVTKTEKAPPPRTTTVTKTEKAPSPPARTTTVTNNTTNVQAASKTAEDESSDGLPWWGWLLIGLAIAGIGIAIFVAGRKRGRDKTSAHQKPAGTTGAEAATGDPLPPSGASEPTPEAPPSAPETGEAPPGEEPPAS
jgi:outer membrane biosynthesis protein TonB